MSALPEEVLRIVCDVAGPDRVPRQAGPETKLAEGGFFLTSLELVEVVLRCEQTFGVFFDPEADFGGESLRSIGSLAETLRRKRSATTGDRGR